MLRATGKGLSRLSHLLLMPAARRRPIVLLHPRRDTPQGPGLAVASRAVLRHDQTDSSSIQQGESHGRKASGRQEKDISRSSDRKPQNVSRQQSAERSQVRPGEPWNEKVIHRIKVRSHRMSNFDDAAGIGGFSITRNRGSHGVFQRSEGRVRESANSKQWVASKHRMAEMRRVPFQNVRQQIHPIDRTLFLLHTSNACRRKSDLREVQ
jgi:hypothetical protein